MTDKLKLCPFCGGEAIFMSDLSESYNFVTCTDCYCRTQVFATKTTPIKIWNTRRPMDSIVEQLKRLPNVNSDYWNFADLIDREDAIEIVEGVQNENL